MSQRRPSVWSAAWLPLLAVVLVVSFTCAPWADAPSADRHVADGPRAAGEAPGLTGVGAGAQDALAAPGDEPAAAPADDDPAGANANANDDDAAAEDTHLRRGLPLTVRHPDVAPVIAVQERHEKDLLAREDVVGVATCLDARGDVAILVLTTVPVDDLPRHLDGVPVVSEVSGELLAFPGNGKGSGGGGGGGGGDAIDRTARFGRPVPIGVSTGHPSITAGTIGCRVTKGGTTYALSNNHVYAAMNAAPLGDPVLQPGTYDGGSAPGDTIGTLAFFEPIDFDGGANTMDAALAACPAGNLGNATPSDGYGRPKAATLEAAFNLQLMKYGRTTGQTNGKVYALNASVEVGYGAPGVATFTGQIIITPGAFSAGGDSGSLVVGKKGSDARRPVGLLFAGSSLYTIATPIGVVLGKFGVTIDGE